MTPTADAETTRVIRGIGRWDLVALMVNITIGAGILGLPARIFDLAHTHSLLVLVLCAALVGIIAICFAEVGSRFTDSGGPYLIARTALGPAPGFVVGWLYWISRVLTFATICNLLIPYVGRFFPAPQGEWLRVLVVSVVVGLITLIHLLGVRHATIAGNALTVLKIAFLAIFGLAGLLSAGELPDQAAVTPRFDDLSEAVRLSIFAFVGFEAALVSAGETRDPRRNVPFAVVISLLIVLALYLALQAVCIATVPLLAESEAPVADAAIILWGPIGEHLVAGAAVAIMLGSLNGGFLATTRLPFAFAEQGDLPPILARVHARVRTPHVAILCSAVLVFAATVASSFLSAITLATSTRMIVYIAGCAALIALRRRPDAPPPAFRAPLGRAFAWLAIILSTVLLATASGRELLQLTIATITGIVVYAAAQARSRRSTTRYGEQAR